MAPLATAQDVADIWRALSDAEAQQATNLLAKASALLRNRLGNIDDRVALFATEPTDVAALDPQIVANVVAGMVKRVMVNPAGAVNNSVSVDGVSRSQSFVGSRFAQPDVGLGELTVSDSDVEKLTPRTKPKFVPDGFMVKTPPQPYCDGLDRLGGSDAALFDTIETGVEYGPWFG